MASILSIDDIAGIQDDIAPAFGDELVSSVAVYRRPSNADGVVAGGAGVDQFGVRVTNAVGIPSSVPVLIGTYPARITRAGIGAEVAWGSQAANIAKFTVSINWALSPDIEGGDTLLADGRTFSVIDPGGATTYKVIRLVKVEEVEV